MTNERREHDGGEEDQVVVAERVEIKDARGRVRVSLGATLDGGFGLRFLDPGGSERLFLGLLDDGPTLSFAAWGEILAEIGVLDEDPEPYSRLVLLDAGGEVSTYLPPHDEGI